jgi:hypothetical protein
MVDTLAREAVDGATLHDALRERRVIAARQINDRRKGVAVKQVVEPLLALPALDAVIEHDDVIADGVEAGVEAAGLERCVDATFRVRPDDRDVLLERAAELGVIRDDQQARRAGRGGDRLGEDIGRGRTPLAGLVDRL